MVETRLSARLVNNADLLDALPGSKIKSNSASDGAATNASYRLIDMPAESAVKVRNILAQHRERGIERACRQRTVLAIQGGTDLNFATRPGNDGPELVDPNQKGAKNLGLHLNATLAVTDSGLPLGVLRVGFDSTKTRPPDAAARRNTRKLLDGFVDIAKAASEMSNGTRVIAVCNLEADCFEMFDAQRRHPQVNLLARAGHDCELGEHGPNLFTLIGSGAPDGLIDVEIEDLAAHPSRRKRLANCELRFRRVAMPTTKSAGNSELAKVSAVHVVETVQPDGENPAQMCFLTTLNVRSAQDAAEVIGFYLQRWRIEDFFRVLKPGCRIEFLPFRTADRLQRAVAINAVIAWRIVVMTLLGREVPDHKPELTFADHELDFLQDYADEHGLPAPDRLGAAVQLVAHLGGYRARKHDPDSGRQVMWHGQTRLVSAAMGHRIGFKAGRRQTLQKGSGADAMQELP